LETLIPSGGGTKPNVLLEIVGILARIERVVAVTNLRFCRARLMNAAIGATEAKLHFVRTADLGPFPGSASAANVGFGGPRWGIQSRD
jgi:hypothetical protein